MFSARFLNQMMSQSTIYSRHEARRARTQQLASDPRPATIRVLSLLPIFNLIVPQFEPVLLTIAKETATPIDHLDSSFDDQDTTKLW